MRTLGVRVYSAEKQNERAKAETVTCSLEEAECPLLKQGKCIHVGIMSRCVYGGRIWEKTSTKRAAAYHKELNAMKEEAAKYMLPDWAHDTGIQEIGEYYYLPYPYMTLCRQVPFKAYGDILSNGIPFIPKVALTRETIVALASFRPQALFGGEITDYQQNVVPAFLLHVKHRLPALYEQAVQLEPSISSKVVDTAGLTELTATLADIPAGVVTGYSIIAAGRGCNVDSWDGETLVVSGSNYKQSSLNRWFLPGQEKSFSCKFVPVPQKVDVVIRDRELIASVVTNNPSVIKCRS